MDSYYNNSRKFQLKSQKSFVQKFDDEFEMEQNHMNIGNGNDNKGFVIESHEVTMRKENEIMKLIKVD